MTDEMSYEQKRYFWKAYMVMEEVSDYREYGMTDKLFVEECKFYKEYLLLDNRIFKEYYITHWDHQEYYIPYVIRVRLMAAAEWAG